MVIPRGPAFQLKLATFRPTGYDANASTTPILKHDPATASMELNESTTVGITGSGGFIGSHLVERLRELDCSVRGLDHDPATAEYAERLGANVTVGDTRDPDAAQTFVDGCDLIIHTAARMGEGGVMSEFRDVNVRGTSTVASAAVDAGVRRFLHLSSVMVYGFDFPPDVDESGPLSGENHPYCQTKIESEDAIRSFHGHSTENGDFEVIIARPGDVYGPGSSPWVVRPLRMMNKGLFVLPDGGRGMLDPTWVGNLVDAFLGLIDADATGETFNVTDGLTITTGDYFSYLARIAGIDHVRTLPGPLVRTIAKTIRPFAHWFDLDDAPEPAAVDFLSKPHGYSVRKLRDTIDTRPSVDLDEGMSIIEQWALDHGLAPPERPRTP